MNILEKQMLEILNDLKQNHCAVGVKAEFEAEGMRLEEAVRLKNIISTAGLDLTIKVGGCEAVKDMFEAKTLDAHTIVAPMVESEYAVQKFVQAYKFVFNEDERKDMKFLINLETKTGFNNLDEIICSPYFAEINGVVIGRGDLCGSLKIDKSEADSEKILEMTSYVCEKLMLLNKEVIVGGEITSKSLFFFSKLPENALTRYETRKIIFNAKKGFNDEEGILKALEFELLWLKNKKNIYLSTAGENDERLKAIEKRYSMTLAKKV